MPLCNHSTLELLPGKKSRVRCRHCHLIIEADELGDGCCPECFEADGRKRYEFEELPETDNDIARYRCADCGIIVESE